MAKGHDRAARRIAPKVKGTYNPKTSPDIKGSRARVEVKSKASEIPKALRQLGGGPGRAYIALPNNSKLPPSEGLQTTKLA